MEGRTQKVEFDSSRESMRNFYIVEERFGKYVKVHHVVLKMRGEKGWYQEATSMQAFRHRMQKRTGIQFDKDAKAHMAKPEPRGRMLLNHLPLCYEVRDSLQWQRDNHPDVACSLYDGLPMAPARALFDFYAAIGYDHRRDRLSHAIPAPQQAGALVTPA